METLRNQSNATESELHKLEGIFDGMEKVAAIPSEDSEEILWEKPGTYSKVFQVLLIDRSLKAENFLNFLLAKPELKVVCTGSAVEDGLFDNKPSQMDIKVTDEDGNPVEVAVDLILKNDDG
jgi:hypothetical protein